MDYKKEYLETLKYIEEFAKKTGYPLDFDTKKLAQLIEQAKTPQEAMDLVKKELKLEPILFADPTQVSELQFFSSSRQFAGSYVPSARTVDDKSVALVNGKGAKDEGQYFASIREDYNNMFLE